MLFQSAEPFGVAAVVAYISCLSLTILLFSAPYFASYFINYYRKLHQIEEAILLISEHRDVSPAPDQKPLPPYSAVSVIEAHDPEFDPDSMTMHDAANLEDANLEGEPTESSSPAVSPEGSEPASSEVKTMADAEESGTPKRISRRESMLRSQDEFQLSLFDAPASPVVGDTGRMTDGADAADALASVLTEIHAYCLLDSGSSLYLRGDPPFSWDTGTRLAAPEVGKYVVDPFPLEEPIRVSFLINDNEKKMSSEWEIEPSISNECYPEL